MSSLPCSVKPLSPPDHVAWCTLRSQLWPHVRYDDHVLETQRLLSDKLTYSAFIAFSSANLPVGFAEAAVRSDYVNGCHTSPVLFLEGIYVIPTARRAGVATALCAAIAEWGAARGLTEFASDTGVDNLYAQALHRALGFEETERVVFFRKRL